MMQFWFALLIFIGSHAISRMPLRDYIIRSVGKKTYFMAYSVFSFITLSWLIYAAVQAPRLVLWPWVHGLYWVPNLLMPLASILLISGFLIPNPLSLVPRLHNFNPARPPMVVAVTRHPILWGFFLWSASHIFPNGEFPLAFMFLIFALLAIAGTKMIDKKNQRILGMLEWQRISAYTSNIPFNSIFFWRGQFSFGVHDLTGILGGVLFYIIFFHLHRTLFAIMPIPPGF